jgi:hypothetical protein
VHDNNNPNVPSTGIAGAAPVGTGIEISGGSFDTVQNNTVDHQGGWGIVTHDFPDTETPPSSGISHCQGGTEDPSGNLRYFTAQGNVIATNTLSDNGGFGNPTNGDLANQSPRSNPRNCFFGNTDPGRPGGEPSSDPPNIQDPAVDGPPCDQPGTGDDGPLAAQLVCAAGLAGPCPGYPQQTQVKMIPLPKQPTMPNPCVGVPNNPWCSNGQPVYPIG